MVVETDNCCMWRTAIRIQSATCTVELSAETIDALNLAARTDAPIYVDETLVEHHVIKDDAGNPLPPDLAWRRYVRSVREWEKERARPPFDTISDVILALKKNPGDYDVRRALTEAAPFCWDPPRIKDTKDAWATFKRWVQRSKGTRREGLAAGLMGAVLLWPKCDARGALPYYEQAHSCLPEDRGIAFELATVYAFTGQAAKALKLLRRIKNKPGAWSPATCGNFRTLWNDPRFDKLFGKPDPRFMNVFAQPQLEIIGNMDDNFDMFTKVTKPSCAIAVPEDTQRRRIEELAKVGNRSHPPRVEQSFGDCEYGFFRPMHRQPRQSCLLQSLVMSRANDSRQICHRIWIVAETRAQLRQKSSSLIFVVKLLVPHRHILVSLDRAHTNPLRVSVDFSTSGRYGCARLFSPAVSANPIQIGKARMWHWSLF